ncbi:MAG TPA: cation:proton antiporter, partial [Phycisphaerae bacterium]
GTLLGPGALNLMSNREAVPVMAELGVALLLFTIGLEFSWLRLRNLGTIGLGGGTLQMLLTGLIAAGIFRALGAGARESIALGALIAPSSTACVLRTLFERMELESVYGRSSVGVLLLQDLAIVPLVLLVTALGKQGSLSQVLLGVGYAAGLAVLLFAGLYGVSNYVLPRLLNVAALSKNRELSILLATATCLGSAYAAHALGLSPALGAFVAGVLLGDSPFAAQLRADVDALRVLFVTLFFCSIGMLADLAWLAAHWPAVAALAAAILIGKALIVWPITWAFLKSHTHALATGICLAQVGEFSFVLIQIALTGGVINEYTFHLFVSATLITLLLTPLLVRGAPQISEQIIAWLARANIVRSAAVPSAEPSGRLHDHVIVVGYGPAGRHVLTALRAAGAPAVLVELNPRTVTEARRLGIQAHVGDASQAPVLEHVHAPDAAAVVVTVPDHRSAVRVIGQARAVAPRSKIIARARYHAYAAELQEAGAHVVIDEENHIGELLGAEVIKHLRPV